jgi:hypothetical protein
MVFGLLILITLALSTLLTLVCLASVAIDITDWIADRRKWRAHIRRLRTQA